MKKILIPFVAMLIAFSGCQENETELSEAAESQKLVYNDILDDGIINALASYNLVPSDFIEEQVENGNGIANPSGLRSFGHVKQKFLTVNNEKIAYFETSGRGPDVLLIHGLSQSSNAFDRQLNSILGKIFHIVSIDLSGHGLSDNSLDPETVYQLPGYADLLVNIVEELNMQHAVFVGWSLGGNILVEAADRLTEAAGFMIFDAGFVSNPFNPEVFLPLPEFPLLLTPDLSEDDIRALIPAFFKPNAKHIPELFYSNLRRQDPLARLYLGVTIGTGNYKDQPGALSQLTIPVAVLQGMQEQIVNPNYLTGLNIPTLWRNKIWIIPNAGHAVQWEQSTLFNILLAAFVIDSH